MNLGAFVQPPPRKIICFYTQIRRFVLHPRMPFIVLTCLSWSVVGTAAGAGAMAEQTTLIQYMCASAS